MVRPVATARLKPYTNGNPVPNHHDFASASVERRLSSKRRSSLPASRTATILALTLVCVLAAAAVIGTRYSPPFRQASLRSSSHQPDAPPPSKPSAADSSASSSSAHQDHMPIPPVSSTTVASESASRSSSAYSQTGDQSSSTARNTQIRSDSAAKTWKESTTDATLSTPASSAKIIQSLHPRQDYPHHCSLLYVSGNPLDHNEYTFNSRSFCLTSSVCIRPSTSSSPSTLYVAANMSQTTCSNVTSAINSWGGPTPNCSRIQSYAMCAHGRFLPPITPVCPSIVPMSELPTRLSSSARWLDGIAFVVPAYPHTANIFHFSFIAGTVSHLVSILPILIRRWRSAPDHDDRLLPNPVPVTLLFRGEPPIILGLWQSSIISAVVNHRLKHAGITVSITSLMEGTPDVTSDIICARSAMFLGRRSHINLWPFPNTQYVDKIGSAVHVESLAFRHALYAASGVDSLIPSMPLGTFTPPQKRLLLDLPPLALGYSRRNNEPDAPAGEAQPGTKRRFSDEDEEWFIEMLGEECKENNMSMHTLQVTETTPLSEQVSEFAKIGFIVGIHGANLMNSIFMKPFGVLMEIFPALNLQCYIEGSNSGLAYYRYHPIRRATGEESGCTEEHRTCWLYPHNRRVMIGEEKDRNDVRLMIKRGIAQLRHLHDRFESLEGVPVVYDDETSVYSIDWDRVPGPGGS